MFRNRTKRPKSRAARCDVATWNVLTRIATVVAAVAVACGVARAGPQAAGPVDDERGALRRQEWLLPSPDTTVLSHAVVFRPRGAGPFPLALIAHASTQNAVRRIAMPLPSYPGLTEALVARGFAVVLPQRPGHGATEGRYLEDQGGCDTADYGRAARATADAIRAALIFMRAQPLVAKTPALVIGHSAGGLGALALAADSPASIGQIIAFAPGRGGYADDRPGEICAQAQLRAAIAGLGLRARVPVTWLVASNDTYFPPERSRVWADGFRAAGGNVSFQVLPGGEGEGHFLAERLGAMSLPPDVMRALDAARARVR